MRRKTLLGLALFAVVMLLVVVGCEQPVAKKDTTPTGKSIDSADLEKELVDLDDLDALDKELEDVSFEDLDNVEFE